MSKSLLFTIGMIGLCLCMSESADWRNIVGLIMFGMACLIGGTR